MKTELGKWNPFKFLRRTTADKPSRASGDESSNVSVPRHGLPDWPDVSRYFSGDPWRAMSEFLHEPFAGFSGLERWFGDFSSSRFQPRIDVVDDGAALRITAELPGMDREDVQTGRWCCEVKRSRIFGAKKTAVTAWNERMARSCVVSPCRMVSTWITSMRNLNEAY